MAFRSWLGNNGSWSDPTQWSGGLPGTLDVASFGAGTYAVQFATTATVQEVISGNPSATFNLLLGALTLTGNAGNDGSWSGTIAQSGGTLVPSNGQYFVNGILTQTGGTIAPDAASRLNVQGTATLGGDVSGNGALAVGGTVTLAGATLNLGSVQMGSTGTLLLASDIDYAGNFVPANGTLGLGGHDLTLSGQSRIGNVQIAGPGTLTVTGTTTFAGLVMSSSGTTYNASIVDTGLIVQDTALGLPSNASIGSVIVAANGIYDLVTDRGIGGTPPDSVTNAGLFEKTAGVVGFNSNISVPFINTGTLRSTTGMLMLTGTTNVLGGTLDGAGTIWLGGTAELTAGAALNVWQFGIGNGALLQLDGSLLASSNIEAGAGSTIALRGHRLQTQGQGQLKGTIQAQGTALSTGSLVVGGIYDVGGLIATGGSLWLEDFGFMVQNGAAIVLGGSATDHVTLKIDPFAVYDITTSQTLGNGLGLIGSAGTAVIINDGTFANYGGGATVGVPFTNDSTGRVFNAYGTLAFTQSFINDGIATFAGTVTVRGGLNASPGHSGTTEIAPGSTLAINGSVNANTTIDFQSGSNSLLLLKSAPLFAGTIDHFTAGQTIDLVNTKVNRVTHTGGNYAFSQVSNGATVLVATLALGFPPASVIITGDGNGGTDILADPPGHAFSGLLTSGTNVSWSGGTISGDWNTGSNWSTGTVPNAVDSVTVGNVGTVVFGSNVSAGTIQSLNGTGIELSVTGGDLVVNNGGTWNGGSLNETGGDFDSVTGYLFAGTSFTQSSGATLTSDSGTLAINNFLTFNAAGTLTGSGAIQIGGVVNFDAAAQINVGTLDIRKEAIFNSSTTLAGRFQLEGSVILQGTTLTLTGTDILAGSMIDPGTIAIAAGATADVTNFSIGTVDLISVAGFAFQGQFPSLLSGDVNGTANGAIAILAGGTYDLEADVSVLLAVGKGALVNAGLFEKTGGSGKSTVDANFVSTGTISVASGTLAISAGALDASGTITGNGILDTADGGSINSLTLEAGTFINIAQVIIGNTVLKGDQSDLSVVNSTATLNLQGHTFTLGGSAEVYGLLTGGGELNLTHQADLADNINGLAITGVATEVLVSGTVTQSGNIALGGVSGIGAVAGDSASIVITATGVFNDLVDGGIFGNYGSGFIGSINNAGIFEKTGGVGITTIVAQVTNTGTIIDAHATLTLSGPVLNDNLISVAGVLVTNGSVGADANASGHIVLGPAGTLIANGTVAASQTIVFDPGGLLQIGTLANFAATIDGFVEGDRIEILNMTSVTSVTYTGKAIQLNGTSGVMGTIAAANIFNPSLLAVATDGTNTFITDTFGRAMSWTGSGGAAFGAAGNWDDLTHGLTPAQSAPGATDAVEFNVTSGAITGSGTVAALGVGTTGTGVLQLNNGSTLVAGSLDAGLAAGAVGQISVTGAGTKLSVTGDATVADDGTGVLSVLAGGTFSAASLTIGSQGNSSGALIVSGAGSVINLVGALNIGTALGVGDLTVGPGAAVHAGVVNLQGQVVLEGGLLDPTVTIINQGQTAGGNGTIQAGDIIDEGVIQAGGTKPSQRLLVVQGTVVGGGTLSINGTVQPSNAAGVLQINASGTMELTAPVLNAATTTFTDNLAQPGTYTVNNSVVDVTFADGLGVLLLDDIAGFGGTITSFKGGDQFVIAGGTLSNLGVSNSNTLTFADSGVNAVSGGIDQIIFGSAVSASNFNIVNGNTVQVACFAAGTRIETETGRVAVEDLRVGDVVSTDDGRSEPIVWIGSRAVNCTVHSEPEKVWPVRIGAGAFGTNKPNRDLWLSPDHAIFVNGVLVPVKLLVNGTTIIQVKRSNITYYHVELPRHHVILAEGLPVESYLEIGDRADFGPGAVTRLFPNFATTFAPDASWAWETRGAASLVSSGPALAAARRRVEEIASILNDPRLSRDKRRATR